MEVSRTEIERRYKEQDFLLYYHYVYSGCCGNTIEEYLMLYALKNQIIVYNGRESHLPRVSPWQYDRVVKRISKCVKNWESVGNETSPLEVIVNFDGVPHRYYGEGKNFKNFHKFHKIVDCIRKGLTIL